MKNMDCKIISFQIDELKSQIIREYFVADNCRIVLLNRSNKLLLVIKEYQL